MKIFTNLLILIAFSVGTSTANAEYRVYQYMVQNVIKTSDEPNAKIHVTTLDPVSYLAYNGGSSLIDADLMRTWICPGYTGARKEYCTSPYEKLAAEVLSE